MRYLSLCFALLVAGVALADDNDGFKTIFDGKSLDGWKKSAENEKAIRLEDGAIVANGNRCHLFYVGDEKPFQDFHLVCEVMTKPSANGGIYFHTRYQEEGWPLT